MVDWGDLGLEASWISISGERKEVPRATLESLAQILGAGGGRRGGLDAAVWVLKAGERPDAGPAWELVFEDGSARRGEGPLPFDMPLGYHRLRAADGRQVAVIVTPRRCHLPPAARGWLWSVQLYALRSELSWGIGDLADLRTAGAWAFGLGASMLMLNPLHAGPPGPDKRDSPYSPSSRTWRDPIYLRVEEVPGAEALGGRLEELASQARALCKRREIDRTAVWRLKSEALEEIFAASAAHLESPASAFASWREARGQSLQRYATYCALAESHGPNWLDWPTELQDPAGPAALEEAAARSSRVTYHAWLQWALQLQLDAASEAIPLLMDLAVGTDAGGADTWIWKECFALGARIGAPPDDFNASGQDWGLVPYHPHRLAEAAFAPFVEALRANLAPGGGLRVDHVMGLWRQWWLPPGAGAGEGAYVDFPYSELLDIVALESVRAAAVVVGEDLGVVEPRVREEMGRRAMLSSKVAIFEDVPPSGWGEAALGSFSTHDLPTVAGLLSGGDLEAQREAAMVVDADAACSMADKIASWAGSSDPSEAVVSLAFQLGASRCALVGMSLEDALGVAERPNMPGTVGTWPNWRLALPEPLEQIMASEQARRVAAAFSAGRGSGPGGPQGH